MNVFELGAKIGLDTSEYDNNLDKSESRFSAIAGKLKSGFETIAKVAAASVAAVGAATTAFVKSAVDTGSQFDSSMSQVAATMGKTVDEIGELRDFAQDMGSKTAFSASQAADALNYMALAGYDANQSMSMLPTVLDLAAAGGIELARASDMVTDAASALGLTFDDTKVMVDQMAMASSKTNTSVAQLGDAILAVGGTAKTLKGGTAELTQTLGLMADNGIKAAEAGTHMRNIMLAMTPSTKDAVSAWEQLGVQAYDNEGKLRNMSDIFTELKSAMSDFSDEERTNILSDMFHVTDLAAVNALLDTSEDRWNAVADAIDGAQGSAAKMAETQLDNLAGDVTLFKSAWEGLQIVVADKVIPVFRPFIQMVSQLVSSITRIVKDGGSLTDVFNRIAIAAEGIWIRIKQGLEKALPKIMEAVPELIQSMIKGFAERANMIMEIAPVIITSLINGIREQLPQLMETATNIINKFSEFINEDLSPILDAAVEILMAIVDGITENLPEIVDTAVTIILTLVEKLTDPDMLTKLIDGALKLILALAQGLIKALPKLLEKAPVIVDNLVTSIVKIAPRLLKAAAELIGKLVNGLTDNLPKIFESGRDIVARLVLGIGELNKKMSEAATELMEKFFGGIKDRYQRTFEVGKEIIGKVKDGLYDMIHTAASWGRDMIDNFIGGIKEKLPSVADIAGGAAGIAGTISKFIHFSKPDEGPLSDFDEYAPDMIDLFVQGINSNSRKLKDAFTKNFNFVSELPDKIDFDKDIEKSFDFAKELPLVDVTKNINLIADLPNQTEVAQKATENVYNVTNHYTVNVTTGTIASDYDARRAAQKMSEQLAFLQNQNRKAVGV